MIIKYNSFNFFFNKLIFFFFGDFAKGLWVNSLNIAFIDRNGGSMDCFGVFIRR